MAQTHSIGSLGEKRTTLNNDTSMPIFGLGTFRLAADETEGAVESAITTGYTLIDTAMIYRNETDIGVALQHCYQKYGDCLDRSKLFITTKLYTGNQGYEPALKAFATSLEKLNCDYVDLYLIHWPGVSGLQKEDPKNREIRTESWRALEKLYADGKAKAIGVSNYTVTHLQEMETYAKILPAVNQVELHPWLPQVELLAYCKEKGIHVQAYSSLAQGELFTEPAVIEIAAKLGKTPSQVLLKWAIQQGISIIPKSKDAGRIRDNANIFDFELPMDDMEKLNSLGKNYRVCWDPNTVA